MSGTAWDLTTQEFHGGQEWHRIANFVHDFSVTTNTLGPPQRALAAAMSELQRNVEHYPSADQQPAVSRLGSFLRRDGAEGRLVLGNGASELIDLVVRSSAGTTWMPGPWPVQYAEYARAARCAGKTLSTSAADLIAVVNPNNPTGEFLPPHELLGWARTRLKQGGTLIVDESMLPWHSSDWRALSVMDAATDMKVFVLHSWTKLWACAGLRIGSVLCPDTQEAAVLRAKQVPWSVNAPALAFLAEAVADNAYLEQVWAVTPKWRRQQCEQLETLGIACGTAFACHGEPWLPWIWMDVQSADLAGRMVAAARSAGVPVRSGLPGYGQSTKLRVRVASPAYFATLLAAFERELSKVT